MHSSKAWSTATQMLANVLSEDIRAELFPIIIICALPDLNLSLKDTLPVSAHTLTVFSVRCGVGQNAHTEVELESKNE